MSDTIDPQPERSTATPSLRNARPRIVLDTNVCLDLWVFTDERVSALAQAIQSGAVQPVTNAGCQGEWERVLGYPQLALPQARRAELLSRYDDCFAHVPSAATGTDHDMTDAPALPRCTDPDDQKFLELARAADARWLLSRDRALLALSSRIRRDDRFDILSPGQWTAQWLSRTGSTTHDAPTPAAIYSSNR